VQRVYGVREDHESKELYSFKHLLQGFRGLPMDIDTLVVREFFLLLVVHGAKKVKNHWCKV
jgi:hypothetical protein